MSVDPLRRCVAQLARFPGIGERTATRLAYWLLRQEGDVAREIGEAIAALPTEARRCSRCFNIAARDPCGICSHPQRTSEILCVVERPQDISAIEETGSYEGRYHVLDGAISPLDGVGPDQLRMRELLARLQPEGVKEVLIATDPDVEGDATALYLAQLLKPMGIRVTRLAHGIAVGTELEYANRSSVSRAIVNRQEL
ncbi:MAG: recombination mediator RecR [Myxococcota bacterium]